MNRLEPLHERLRKSLSPKHWATLDQIVARVGTTSKSYCKVTLLAMPDVEHRRVLVKSKDAPINTWRWEFRLIEGMP